MLVLTQPDRLHPPFSVDRDLVLCRKMRCSAVFNYLISLAGFQLINDLAAWSLSNAVDANIDFVIWFVIIQTKMIGEPAL